MLKYWHSSFIQMVTLKGSIHSYVCNYALHVTNYTGSSLGGKVTKNKLLLFNNFHHSFTWIHFGSFPLLSTLKNLCKINNKRSEPQNSWGRAGRCFCLLPRIPSFTHILNGTFTFVQDDTRQAEGHKRKFIGLNFYRNTAPQGGTPDFKWREWSKDFFAFEIFNSGIFLGREIWQVFFWVAWFKKGFFGHSKQSEDSW